MLDERKLEQISYLCDLTPELQARISAEFADFVSTEMQRQLDDDTRRDEYERMDVFERIAMLTNNFYLWWPEGWYRQIHIHNKTKEQIDPSLINIIHSLIACRGLREFLADGSQKNMVGNEALIPIIMSEDLILAIDKAIKEAGLEDMIDLVQDKESQGQMRETRLTALAIVYFMLRDQGYDRDRLRA